MEHLNEFLDYSQETQDLENFYQHFLKLVKYAPASMNQHAKVARFVSHLNSPLKERLQSLRLITFADVLDADKPIETKINYSRKRASSTISLILLRELI